MIDINSAHLRL